MARLVIVNSDTLESARLAEQLRRQGHVVEAYTDLFSAHGSLAAGPDLVLATMDALPAEAIGAAGDGLTIVWTGPAGPPPELPPGVATYLGVPSPEGTVRACLERLVKAQPDDRWSGREFLEIVDGPLSRFPPARVLFLAHRVEGSGRMLVRDSSGTWSVDLFGGEVVGCRGIGRLMESIGLSGEPDDDLGKALSRAIGRGTPPDQALAAAAEGIGRAVARTVAATVGSVQFTVGAPGGTRPLRLPVSVPRLLASGLAHVRPSATIRRELARRRNERPLLHPPADSHEEKWGLTPRALRLLRRANRVETLGELVGEGREGENDENWLSVDFLMQLGLISLAPAIPVARAPEPAEPPPPAIEPPPPPPPAPPEEPEADEDDPQAADLRRTMEQFQRATPWEVLEVVHSRQASEGAINRQFLEVSARFHPDRFVEASPHARALAAECFALITDAHEKLKDPEEVQELEKRLLAAEQGRAYAPPRDRATARMVAKRGEAAFRKKDWIQAHRCFAKAVEVVPTEWRYCFRMLHSGWLAGEIAPSEAAERLVNLEGPVRREAAEVLFVAGEILLREGKDREAYKIFARVVDLDPEHVGARRHIRLKEMRSRDEPEAAGGSVLKGLFRRGKDS